jgi:hypothetical protein
MNDDVTTVSNAGDRHKGSETETEWDKQIKEDAGAGKLDDIARQVKEKYEEGRTKPLP